MTVGDLKAELAKYSDSAIIAVEYYTQDYLLEMCAEALDCEVLDVGIDTVAYVSDEMWKYMPSDVYLGFYEAISIAAHEYIKKISSKPNDYELDTPLGQQYSDGAEVDQ